MPTISLSLPASGTVITAGLHVSNYNDLQALLNGNLDASNLANLAVTTGKIANGAVTPAKISAGEARKFIGGVTPAYSLTPGTVITEVISTSQLGPTGVTLTSSGGDVISSFPSATYPAGRYFVDFFLGGFQTTGNNGTAYLTVTRASGSGLTGWLGIRNVQANVQTMPISGKAYFDLGAEITEQLQFRWGGDGSGLTYTVTNGGGGTNVYIVTITYKG